MSTVPFSQIPATVKVPRVYIEVDSSRADQGSGIQPYRILAIGQRLTTGTKPAEELLQVTDAAQAREWFGAGSMLAQQLAAIFAVNKSTPVYAVALDDDGAAVDATGNILFGGSPTAAGTVFVHIGGRRYKVGVASTDTPADVAAALVAEITADADATVTAAVNGGTAEQVDLTAKNAGEAGNQIAIYFNYFGGSEELPAGLTQVTTAMSGGTANPDIADAFAVLDEEQYNLIAMPYDDTANLTALDNEFDDRFGPIRDNWGWSCIFKRVTHTDLLTFVDGKNSKNYSVLRMGGPNNPWEFSAQCVGAIATELQIDPARPLQTIALDTMLAPLVSERSTWTERDLQLNAGAGTIVVDTNGTVRIERIVTTYLKNENGADDDSFRDLNPIMTVDFIRYDLANQWALTFPRAKLADDGVNLGPGQQQVVVTPKTAKNFLVNLFKEWEQRGLVENVDQFKQDLVVVRSQTDNTRLDVILPPDLVNQLRVSAFLLQFRL